MGYTNEHVTSLEAQIILAFKEHRLRYSLLKVSTGFDIRQTAEHAESELLPMGLRGLILTQRTGGKGHLVTFSPDSLLGRIGQVIDRMCFRDKPETRSSVIKTLRRESGNVNLRGRKSTHRTRHSIRAKTGTLLH